MAELDELIEHMRKGPQDIRFADACTVANAFFGKPRQKGTSHRVWKMPWAGDPRVNLQEGKGGTAKAYQVQQLLKAIDRLRAEQAQKTDEAMAPAKLPQKPESKRKKRK